MATYFVDDGGDNSDGSTWAKAYTSIQALDTAVAIASGDLIYIGADSNCTDNAAALSITGPTSGAPAVLISSTVGSGTTVSYSVGTGDQILATGGTYNITFNGTFALVGIRIKAGGTIQLNQDANEQFSAENCTFVIGDNQSVNIDGSASQVFARNCTFDLSSDTTARSAAVVLVSTENAEILSPVFTSPTNRTGNVFSGNSGVVRISNADLSVFSNATLCEPVAGNYGFTVMSGCKLSSAQAATPAIATGNVAREILMTNCSTDDAPEWMFHQNYFGSAKSSTSVYRSSGQSVETIATSWAVVTTANATEYVPYRTPWVYGVISSTGSKTFTVYVSQDGGSADLTDAEIWLEVEYMGTANVGQTTLATDQRANITASAVAQTDDTTSTWTGITATYKQSLAVTATVNEDGLYRARVAVAASNATVYVDPKVTVS